MLDGVRLVLLCPNLPVELREDVLLGVESVREETGGVVAVLELARVAHDGVQDGRAVRVAWPCAMEKLQQRIDDVLLEGMKAPQPPSLSVAPL